MNVAHNAASYTWAAGIFLTMGISAFDMTIGIFVGCIILSLGCVLSGLIGQKTGSPYPVISRITWGIWGANIAAVIRGVVAIAWYGVQTYLASIALNAVITRIWSPFGDLSAPESIHFLGLHLGGWICFLLLSLLQLIIVQRGMEAIRHVQGFAGPIIWITMLGAMVYFLNEADWKFDWFSGTGDTPLATGAKIGLIALVAAQVVSQLAPVMLNYSDFARFTRDSRTVKIGTILGAPLNWTLFAVTSVLTTGAAVQVLVVDHETLKDPGILMTHVENDLLFYIFAGGFTLATVGVNVISNFVSAAFDVTNLAPGRISFRRAGIATAIIAVVVTPWNYFNSPIVVGYFLGSLGALIGPLFGIMVADFFIVRRQRFVLRHMFLPTPESIYYYNRGVSLKTLWAFIPSGLIALVIAVGPGFGPLKDFSWFIGAGLAVILHLIISNGKVIVLPQNEAADSTEAVTGAENP
ncbi:NCS1 family nucleobase:cation symporter-1 [Microbacterium pseudoresistens]|uniref:NCS1 family nucleobase:cation symporter-1 n=2 Tax=Microbacterium pseudoresistens TaxID=640634 RepID=A0A7Y9EVR6_9MICO|nr:NCS1 family nucleobase:cation symporter-1 [Microbacterium pseudoresistens]